jgi:LPXTG-site transpeptidase (sortase) family protein
VITKAADANYTATTSAPFNIALSMGTPTLYVTNSPVSFDGNPHTATLRAKMDTGDLASGAGTIDGILYNGSETAPTNPGTYAVNANFTPSSSNSALIAPLFAAPAGNFVILGLAQVITFTSTAPVGAVYGDAYTPTAVSTSGLPVTITVDAASSAVCEIHEGVVYFVENGTCIIDANQAGSDYYAPATQVQQIIGVGKAVLTITAHGVNKTYDGTTAATVTFTDDRLHGEVFTIKYTAANFSDPAVGTGKTVTVTGITLTGTGADKYAFNPTATTTADILTDIGPVVLGVHTLTDKTEKTLIQDMNVGTRLFALKVAFDKDVIHVNSGSPDYGKSVLNPANYRLLFDNHDGFQTASCSDNVDVRDIAIPVTEVTYTNGTSTAPGPYVATVIFNNGQILPQVCHYRFYVCGTTSITDLAGIKLAGTGGVTGTDFKLIFGVQSNDPTVNSVVTSIPATGFAPNRVTILPAQPANRAYFAMGPLWVEIPSLGVATKIVGVPQLDGSWDAAWLDNDAGWLQGSAFPPNPGNSVLVGHYFNSSGTAGPFRYISLLSLGDKIIVHAYDVQYVYVVRSVQQVTNDQVATMMKHEEKPWVTLVTCIGYVANYNFAYRVLVRAEQVQIIK